MPADNWRVGISSEKKAVSMQLLLDFYCVVLFTRGEEILNKRIGKSVRNRSISTN